MKALTVQQPWAECIAVGAKLVENRSRPLSYRGPLAIHAGLRWSDRGARDDLVVRTLIGPDALGPLTKPVAHDFGIHCGLVLAVGQLVDCHPAAGCCKPWGEESYDGKLVHHLVLEEIRRIEPVPASGRLGLWDVTLAGEE